MDWALTTGKVMMGRHGGSHPVGLSMIGTPVIKAFLLEKLADETTGSILVCEATRSLAGELFRFHDFGAMPIRGFPSPERVFALVEAR
jgi:class 3 adenylate cyclase